ncbi:MAG: NupC/NupG family nucleoside CNT transporter [Planctomycetota bacterium]|nr:NupC/NupG family nucleoside CNT transporter [Planctomycetota bacterium]
MERAISFIGLFVMMFIAWGFSTNRKKMDFRIIGGGLALQFALALLILKTSPGEAAFEWAKNFVNTIISLSDEGAQFVFGPNFTDHFFAFKVLPTIIFVSSLSYLLFYFGVLQKLVELLASIMNRVMGVSGSESLCTAANVFIGQTEAPLFIQPYLRTMTLSEINCMMTGGMATVAGGVLAAYVGMGISAGHLLAASIMSAPAAILIAKIMLPETEESPTMGTVKVSLEIKDVNAFEAACRGASEGLKLALNVAAMLIAFIALIALVNKGLQAVVDLARMLFDFLDRGPIIPPDFSLSLQMILGWVFQPIAFVMGIPWSEAGKVGSLLGQKMIINEFVAYLSLAEMVKNGELSERSVTIATYALCGFANFSSIAIQIGGIGALEPDRKSDFAKVGLKAMIGGTLAAFMTACIAGVLV